MPRQVPLQVGKERNARLRALFSAAALEYQAGFLGQVLPVLWEAASALGPEGWRMSGLTDNYLRVNALAPQNTWNRITAVRLESAQGEAVMGEIVSL
jgi:threonylcarbamoyladenosine tRNA methylthiotransferase MtaB